jgi:hypothetical protein
MDTKTNPQDRRTRAPVWLLALLLVLLAAWVMGPGAAPRLGIATPDLTEHRSLSGTDAGRQTHLRAGSSAPGLGAIATIDTAAAVPAAAQGNGGRAATAGMAVAMALGLVGLLLAVTLRQGGDAAYAAACFLWAGQIALAESWLSWAQHGLLQAMLLGFCGLIGWTSLRVLDIPVPRGASTVPAVGLAMVAVLIWTLSAIGAMDHTIGQGLVLVLALMLGMALLVRVLDVARSTPSSRQRIGAWVLAVSLAIALACLVHEMSRVLGLASLLGAVLPGAALSEGSRWAILALLTVLLAVRLDQLARSSRRLGAQQRVAQRSAREALRELDALRDELGARDRVLARRQQRDLQLCLLHDELSQRVQQALTQLARPAPALGTTEHALAGQALAEQALVEPAAADQPAVAPAPLARHASQAAVHELLELTRLDLQVALAQLERDDPPLGEALDDLRRHIQPLVVERGLRLNWHVGAVAARQRLGDAATLQLLRTAQEALLHVAKDAVSGGQASLAADVVEVAVPVIPVRTSTQLRLRVRHASGVAVDGLPAELPGPARPAREWKELLRLVKAMGARLDVGQDIDGWSVVILLPLTPAA